MGDGTNYSKFVICEQQFKMSFFLLKMKSHESLYTEELRSVISTAYPLQQSKAVAASNGGLTVEREVHEGIWKLPRGILDRKKFTYIFYYCKGETFFIMVVSLRYIFIWRILRINFQYMSIVT